MSPGACLVAQSECSNKLGRETGFHLPSCFLTASRFSVFLTASKTLDRGKTLYNSVNTTEQRGLHSVSTSDAPQGNHHL